MGKLLQEVYLQPITDCLYPLAHICRAETMPTYQVYTCTSMQSHMLQDTDPIYPGNKFAESLKYNMATVFTGWCSHKAGAGR